MKPRVIKYADGTFMVYDGLKCYHTDRVNALKRVSQLMIKGVKFEYFYEDAPCSPINFFKAIS